MFFIGSTIFVLPDMVLKSSSSCVFRLSSVIAYPVLGLGYTILRQLFNAIFTVLLTRNLLFKSGSHFCSPADLKEKTVLGIILFWVSFWVAYSANAFVPPHVTIEELFRMVPVPGHEPFCRESCNCIRDDSFRDPA